MDITEYLNSKTVAEHFQKIGFQGSAFEQAYLISRSFRHSLEQKQHAWAELINSSSDYVVWDTLMPRYPITLQDLLHEITRVQNVYLEQFFRLEEALFECKILKSGGYSDSDYKFYHSFEACFRAAEEMLANSFGYIQITKRYFESNAAIVLTFSPDRTVYELRAEAIPEQDIVWLEYFDNVSLRFPLPFRKGDILNYLRLEGVADTVLYCGERPYGQQSAYTINCYDDGELYDSWYDDSLNFEVCENVPSERKSLQELSDYVNGISKEITIKNPLAKDKDDFQSRLSDFLFGIK